MANLPNSALWLCERGLASKHDALRGVESWKLREEMLNEAWDEEDEAKNVSYGYGRDGATNPMMPSIGTRTAQRGQARRRSCVTNLAFVCNQFPFRMGRNFHYSSQLFAIVCLASVFAMSQPHHAPIPKGLSAISAKVISYLRFILS